MKYFLILIFLGCGNVGFSQKQNIKLPNEVKKFVLKNYEVYDFVEGDINNDKRKDALLILKHKLQGTLDNVTDEYKYESFPFIILLRNKENQLYKFLRTDSLVPILVTPTYYGDLDIDTLTHNKFKISFWGGRRCKWYRDLTFEFKKTKRQFYLIKEENNGFCGGDSTSDYEYTTKENELNNVSIDKFNYDCDGYESYDRGKIIFDTIFVYSSPDFKASKLPYALKETEVYVGMQTKNFIEISLFGNENEKVLKGFVLKKNIKLYK